MFTMSGGIITNRNHQIMSIGISTSSKPTRQIFPLTMRSVLVLLSIVFYPNRLIRRPRSLFKQNVEQMVAARPNPEFCNTRTGSWDKGYIPSLVVQNQPSKPTVQGFCTCVALTPISCYSKSTGGNKHKHCVSEVGSLPPHNYCGAVLFQHSHYCANFTWKVRISTKSRRYPR